MRLFQSTLAASRQIVDMFMDNVLTIENKMATGTFSLSFSFRMPEFTLVDKATEKSKFRKWSDYNELDKRGPKGR